MVYRLLGTSTVDHHAVWHLRRTLPSQGQVADLYVDRRTFHWVRILGYDGGCAICLGPSFQMHFTFDYSRVNAPLHITAPKVGSTTPGRARLAIGIYRKQIGPSLSAPIHLLP